MSKTLYELYHVILNCKHDKMRARLYYTYIDQFKKNVVTDLYHDIINQSIENNEISHECSNFYYDLYTLMT